MASRRHAWRALLPCLSSPTPRHLVEYHLIPMLCPLLEQPLAPCALPARGSAAIVPRDWRKFVLFGVMAARGKIPAADQRRGPLHVQSHVKSLGGSN